MCHLLVASAMEKEDAGSADPVGEGECAISAIIGESECAASLYCNGSRQSSLCINMLSYIY